MREHLTECPSLGPESLRRDAEQAPPAEWNDTSESLPDNVMIPELVAAQARTTPDALAVIANGEAISYRQLDMKASRLAHHLLSRGAGPERLDRSSRGFGRYSTDSGRDRGKINFQLLGTYGSVRTPVPGAPWALAVACR